MSSPLLPRHILIIRLSAIGDVIMATGLISALLDADPSLRLAWLTEDSNSDLLRDNPRLEQVFLLPRRRWQGYFRERKFGLLWREMRGLIQSLRAEKFDLVLDLQGLLRSGLWARLAGGRRRIGLGSREGSQWLMDEVVDRQTEDERIGSEYRKLAEALGIAEPAYWMDIAISRAVQASVQDLLAGAGVEGRFAVFCPFTTRPQKHWFEESWVALAKRLAEERGLRVVLLGGPADQDSAERIAQATAGLVNFVGRTSLIECAALIAKADLLVGVDTGLTHLGTALRIPTLALFGSTRPYLDTDFAQGKVLYAALPCSPCKRRPSCDGRFDCMRQHTVETILAEATTLLETTP